MIDSRIGSNATTQSVSDLTTSRRNVVSNLTPVVDDSELVGIQERKDELEKRILEEKCDSNHPRVLSIYGIAGTGKTTLARKIYVAVESKFDFSAMISVSQNPDLMSLVRSILRQIIVQEVNKSYVPKKEEDNSKQDAEEEKKRQADEKLLQCGNTIIQLMEALCNRLRDKRYFIVMDDIWDDKVWQNMERVFLDDKLDSVILITTRIYSVAKACCYPIDCEPYKMKPLNEEDSRYLFQRRIFGPEEHCPNDLKDIFEALLKKCGCIPLAIICLSSALTRKPKVKTEWEKVDKALGFHMETDSDMETFKEILSLSFSFLPYHLKTCLLYLSIYPEDYEILKSDLIDMWIVEGFISPKRGMDLKEIGEMYFDDLINSNMIQPADIDDFDGKVKSCRVHDMILELIVLLSSEENFITLVDDHLMSLPKDKIRRLSLQGNHKDMKYGLGSARTLLVFGDCFIVRELTKFKSMKLLDLGHCTWNLSKKDLKSICKLVQLKYLRIGSTSCGTFPNSISDLVHLELLDISKTDLDYLPRGLVKLQGLIHLKAKRCRLPQGYGNLTNLQTLTGVVLHRWNISELKRLCQLRTLSYYFGLGDLESALDQVSCVIETFWCCCSFPLSYYYRDTYDHPFEVEVNWLNMQEFSVLSYSISAVYKGIAKLQRLKQLKLRVKELRPEDMENLSSLLSLHTLKLEVIELNGGINPDEFKGHMVVHGDRFTNLKFLSLSAWKWDAASLHSLTFEAGSLRKVVELILDIPCFINERETESTMENHTGDIGQSSQSQYAFQVTSKAKKFISFRSLPSIQKLTILPLDDDGSLVSLDSMPVLEELNINCGWHGCILEGIEKLPRLKSVNQELHYEFQGNMKKTVSYIRNAVEKHPNKPVLKFTGWDDAIKAANNWLLEGEEESHSDL